MKPTALTLALFLAAGLPLGALRAADHPATDPLTGAFFPPEMIVQLHEQIGLSPEQMEKFRASVERVQGSSEGLEQRLERENAALSSLVHAEHVDELALSAQLDKVLDAESDLKHLHLGLLAEIKNLLTPEQQAKLQEMAKNGGAGFAQETRARITGKVSQVQAGMQQWQASGRDPAAIGQAMQEECQPLLQAGKVAEAEAVLDRLLHELEAGNK